MSNKPFFKMKSNIKQMKKKPETAFLKQQHMKVATTGGNEFYATLLLEAFSVKAPFQIYLCIHYAYINWNYFQNGYLSYGKKQPNLKQNQNISNKKLENQKPCYNTFIGLSENCIWCTMSGVLGHTWSTVGQIVVAMETTIHFCFILPI